MRTLLGLRELRLAKNVIYKIPDTLINPQILTLDLGHNVIAELKDLDQLAFLKLLRNLNLQGNPVTKKEGYKEKVGLVLRSLIDQGVTSCPKTSSFRWKAIARTEKERTRTNKS
jgi:hypothetical protein